MPLVKLRWALLQWAGLWPLRTVVLARIRRRTGQHPAGRGRQFLFSVSSRILCVFVRSDLFIVSVKFFTKFWSAETRGFWEVSPAGWWEWSVPSSCLPLLLPFCMEAVGRLQGGLQSGIPSTFPCVVSLMLSALTCALEPGSATSPWFVFAPEQPSSRVLGVFLLRDL